MNKFSKPEKGAHGCLGYGYRNVRRSRYSKRKLRKAYREIRRYGFDLSELWNLDTSIRRFLSDEFGGWFNNTYSENPNEDNVFEDEFKSHLRELLKDKDALKKVADFAVPRLKIFNEENIGFPSGKYPEFEDWQKEINNMISKFEKSEYAESFIDDFFSIWW